MTIFIFFKNQMEASLASVSVVVGSIVPDEERLVLSKLGVHFSFTYGVLRGLSYNCLNINNL